jgi:hypothetical protein
MADEMLSDLETNLFSSLNPDFQNNCNALVDKGIK